MAAIARFISFDGGIAFSEHSLKIQKRDAGSGKIIQLSEIVEMRVSEPLFGDDGSIGILLRGERRISEKNTIYFDEDQYEEAAQFKAMFDGVVADSKIELPPLEIFTPKVPARRGAALMAMQPARRQQLQQLVQAGNRSWSARNRVERQPKRERPHKRGRLKKIIVYAVVAMLGLSVIGGVFGISEQKSSGGGILETKPTAAASEAWVPETDSFVEMVRDAVEGQTPENEPVIDVTLIDGDLHIYVDYSNSNDFTQFENWYDLLDEFLITTNDSVSEAVLTLGEQYDVLWNTITVDFGDYGKIVNEKSAVSVLDFSEYGVDRQERYFTAENRQVIHDVPVPGAPAESGNEISTAVIGTIGAAQVTDQNPEVGFTSPPIMTSAPATPAPTQKPVPAETSYVLNTSTMKFHYPSCQDVAKIDAGNRRDYTGTRESVIAMGYDSCGHCHP